MKTELQDNNIKAFIKEALIPLQKEIEKLKTEVSNLKVQVQRNKNRYSPLI